MTTKLLTLADAIDRFVPHGSSVVLGTALESHIPFAAGHEIMRQAKRDLTLIGPISDILFDQMIGAGCVRKTQTAWMDNVITGSGYNIRRAVEGGHLLTEDHSNLTITLALQAAAVTQVHNREAYCQHIGTARLEALRPTRHAPAAVVDYGY